MLRVAGRRISSHLAWRPAAAASAGSSPLAGGLPGDDFPRDQNPRFAIESPFHVAARGALPAAPVPPSMSPSDLRHMGNPSLFLGFTEPALGVAI
ncbi:unnamed protein product [Triticum turgidum subsp. durum]|uniref:Uncharacterized protein n=1 Tax=Triticum turgidum subsp. durum TaxID=4567 RepID=A0A9R0YN08_TRITD|nr:unnamed protein product [Triticum turgidum subsp. durum]